MAGNHAHRVNGREAGNWARWLWSRRTLVPWISIVGLVLVGGLGAYHLLLPQIPSNSSPRGADRSRVRAGGTSARAAPGLAGPTRTEVYRNNALSLRVEAPDGWTVTLPDSASAIDEDYMGTLFVAGREGGPQVSVVRLPVRPGRRDPAAYLSEPPLEQIRLGRFDAAKAQRLYARTGLVQYAVVRQDDVLLLSAYVPPERFEEQAAHVEQLVGGMTF